MLPGWTLVAIAMLIGIYWILTGILQIAVAIDFRKVMKGELLLIAAGILSVIVGVLLFVYPIAGLITLAQVIGIFAIAEGIILIVLAAKLALTPHRAPAAV
jgi:uncharacterized membrane protein HdeD (DUF308 family)